VALSFCVATPGRRSKGNRHVKSTQANDNTRSQTNEERSGDRRFGTTSDKAVSDSVTFRMSLLSDGEAWTFAIARLYRGLD